MTPEEAFDHCRKHGRNQELEKIVLSDLFYSYLYAVNVIKGRWPEAEKIILSDTGWAYFYAQDVIKGRWIEAENIIATDPRWAYLYAREIIKGKLPEDMHNAMILHSIIKPKDKNIRTYLKSKKYKINKLTPSV